MIKKTFCNMIDGSEIVSFLRYIGNNYGNILFSFYLIVEQRTRMLLSIIN